MGAEDREMDKRYLFLEGASQIGKSTVIRDVLLEKHQRVTGFFVARHYREDGEFIGFSLEDADELTSENISRNTQFFLKRSQGKMVADLTVFETRGVALLNKALAEGDKVVLLDEIGGVELMVPGFTDALFRLLNGHQKIIGVYKADENFSHQKRHSQYTMEIEEKRKILRGLLEKNGYLIYTDREELKKNKQCLKSFLS